jgi:hypothetical protein
MKVTFEAVKEQLKLLGHCVPDDVIHAYLNDVDSPSPTKARAPAYDSARRQEMFEEAAVGSVEPVHLQPADLNSPTAGRSSTTSPEHDMVRLCPPIQRESNI